MGLLSQPPYAPSLHLPTEYNDTLVREFYANFPWTSTTSPIHILKTAIQSRRIELTQSQHDTPIDENKLYLSVVERDDEGRIYGLGWTPSGRGASMLQLKELEEDLEVEMELDLFVRFGSGTFISVVSLGKTHCWQRPSLAPQFLPSTPPFRPSLR
ncbi:hypothetical protein Scep_014261 [Stephania cephalantha]|uniref:Uncharacterized protein n=1 Tax=Stephania cephalantha TaxID=152367 RepID=A0AAP0J285_9MAGN